MRGPPVELAATEYDTLPLPLLLPLVMVIQETDEDAVHAHPARVVTETVPVDEPAGAAASVGDSA